MKPIDFKREFFSVKSKKFTTQDHCILRLFNPNSVDECFIKNVESVQGDTATIVKIEDGVYVTKDVSVAELLKDGNYVLDVLFEPCLLNNNLNSDLNTSLSSDAPKVIEDVVLADGGELSEVIPTETQTPISYEEYYSLYLDKVNKILSNNDYSPSQIRTFFEIKKNKIEYLYNLNTPIDKAVSIICLPYQGRILDGQKGVHIFYFKDGKVDTKTQKINPRFTFQENLYEIKKAINDSSYYNYVCKINFEYPISYSSDSVLVLSKAIIKELNLLESNEFCFVLHKSKLKNDNSLLFYSKNTFSTKSLYIFADKIKGILNICSICDIDDKFSMKY